jgi:hypothetical protein
VLLARQPVQARHTNSLSLLLKWLVSRRECEANAPHSCCASSCWCCSCWWWLLAATAATLAASTQTSWWWLAALAVLRLLLHV